MAFWLAAAVLTGVRGAQAFEPYAPERITDAEAEPDPEERERAHGGGFFEGERGFAAQLMAGPGYRNLYGVHMIGGDVELAFGAQTKGGGIYGRINLFLARTLEGGLTVIAPAVAPTWEAPIGPFRLGLGIQISMLGYIRSTTQNYQAEIGIGPRAHAHWDFAKSEAIGGFLGLRGGADFYVFDDGDAVVPDLALHVGVRFF